MEEDATGQSIYNILMFTADTKIMKATDIKVQKCQWSRISDSDRIVDALMACKNCKDAFMQYICICMEWLKIIHIKW